MNVVGWSAYTETSGLQKYFVSWTKCGTTDKFYLLRYHFAQVFPSSVAISSLGENISIFLLEVVNNPNKHWSWSKTGDRVGRWAENYKLSKEDQGHGRYHPLLVKALSERWSYLWNCIPALQIKQSPVTPEWLYLHF